jgi:hypothetical protein
MMKTVMDSVNFSTLGVNRRDHRIFTGLQGFVSKVPLRDSRLIGDDCNPQTDPIEAANRSWNARKQPKLRHREWRINDTRVLMIYEAIYHTVAVKQDSLHVFETFKEAASQYAKEAR